MKTRINAALLLEETLLSRLTSAAVASIAPRPLGVLNYHPLPTQLLPVQVIHGIVGITGVIELNEPVPAGNSWRINHGPSTSKDFLSFGFESRPAPLL